MLTPPVMPRAATFSQRGGKPIDYYEISVKQFAQQILPAIAPLPAPVTTRPLALMEMMSMYWDGPAEAVLGTVDEMGMPMHMMWSDPITENPNVGDTEDWEFYNFTADAHPMHIHEITFAGRS